MTEAREIAGPGLWSLFQAFTGAGFTRTEALVLLLHFTPGTIRTLTLPETKMPNIP